MTIRSSLAGLAAAVSMLALVPALGAEPAAYAKEGPSVAVTYRQWTAADFGRGTFDGTAVSGDALVLTAPTGTFDYTDPYGDGSATYDVGTWTSPVVTPGFAFTQLVSSWNATTPPGTWIQMSVRGRADDGTMSKPYILGRWASGDGTIHRTSVPGQGDDLATVAIDTLMLRKDRTMSTWQLTVSLLRRAGTSASPSVTLVGAMSSALPDTKKVPASPLGGAEGVTLDVPTYSQEIHKGQYPEWDGGGEAWCSPTSTSMVVAYWGGGPSPADYSWVDPSYADPWVDYAAANTFDYNYDGAGNWPFNAAYAARWTAADGAPLVGFVTRLRSLTEAEQFIKAGIPLVVSVSFKKNELTGAGYSTGGHLLVIVGFTASGDVVVNDPASHLIASDDAVRTVYNRAQFENVWIPSDRSGGIAYVIRPADVPLPPAPAQANW
ncbi:MAG TPA: C39 family peptidase [Nocardioidaceae bacterium]|nr:C39 family peptidase [Nocardioidaceae bacterium]